MGMLFASVCGGVGEAICVMCAWVCGCGLVNPLDQPLRFVGTLLALQIAAQCPTTLEEFEAIQVSGLSTYLKVRCGPEHWQICRICRSNQVFSCHI